MLLYKITLNFFIFMFFCSYSMANETKQTNLTELEDIVFQTEHLYQTPISLDEHSKLTFRYHLPNEYLDRPSEGMPGLTVFLREEKKLIEIFAEELNVFSRDREFWVELVFNAAPGDYLLNTKLEYFRPCALCFSYSSDSPDVPATRATIRVEIAASNINSRFPWANAFVDWLLITELDHVLSFGDSVKQDLPAFAPNSLLEFNSKVEGLVVSLNTSFGGRSNDSPKYFSIFDKKNVREFEKMYYDNTQTDIWWRILTKLSLLSGLSKDRIAISFPLYCSTGWVRGSNDIAGRFGSECAMATDARAMDFKFSDKLSASHILGLEKEIITDFPALVGRNLTEVAKIDSGGVVDYLTRSSNYVEAVVSGRRGIVIDGGSQWERVQIAVSLSEDQIKSEIRVFVDGMLASGAGSSAPPTTRYLTSMEPKYSQDLNQFSERFIDKLVNFND